jgi:hypothetical protein
MRDRSGILTRRPHRAAPVQFHDPKLAAAAFCLRSGAIERMTEAARPVAHAAVYCLRVGLKAGGSNGPQRAAHVVSRPLSTSGGGGPNLTAPNRPRCCSRPCPHLRAQRTQLRHYAMSLLCQKRKHWIGQLYFRLASCAVFTVRNGLDHPI